MPWLFIGVILILVYFGIGDLLVMAADAKDSTTLTAAELKDRIDELKWVLGLIVIAAGLFTTAQGVAAGFTARNFTDQAEKILSDVKARFKTFSLLEERRDEAYANLTNLEHTLALSSPVHSPDEGFNWRRRFYANMSLTLRQEIYSAERVFPYEVVAQNEPIDVYVSNLRRLAQFYWAKFIYEQDRRAGYLGDLERAEYLLELALRKSGTGFYLLNDMGNIRIEHFKILSKSLPLPRSHLDAADLEMVLVRARQNFKESIAVQKRQLRAYFNLAFVEADLSSPLTRAQSLRTAVQYLREGLRYPNWEREPVDEFRCSALYNLACYYARLAPDEPLAERNSIAVLRKTARLGLISPLDVDRDFNTQEGDFFRFIRNSPAETRALYKKLESDLSRNYI